MEGELPVTYNFYNEIKYGTLPSQYDNFLQSISKIYKLEPEKAYSFFYELETNNHKFYKITRENYSELSKNKNATIYIYFTDEEFHVIDNYEEEEDDEEIEDDKIENKEVIINENPIPINNKVEKKQVINNILSKIKKLREIKAAKEKEKEDKQINNIEELISQKIKDLTAELVKETNMGVSTILENSKMEKLFENNEKKEYKKICVSIHNGIECNGCKMKPIKGLRYKCSICPDVNFCQKCEENLGEKHNHPLFKLKYEIEELLL